MARFDSARYMTLTPDRKDLNIYDAKFRDLRFAMVATRSIEVDASTEANLPGLAETYLGDQSLWWVILEFNGLLDPIQDIRAGVQLLIPERRAVIAFLEARENADGIEYESI